MDAIHFASAKRVSQASPASMVFVAADKDFVQAAKVVGFTTIGPEEQGALEKLRSLR